MYSPAKVGKSEFVLSVAVALATGRGVLRQSAADPIDVVYLDYEMTEDDLDERLGDLGYEEGADLEHFHYYLLPNLPPLDSAKGGKELESIVSDDHAALVIIDTTSRAVEGDENESDTVRALYRHSGLMLKRRGVTVARLDNAGKDLTRGQRGTSAKNDDVDIVWRITRSEGGVDLRATYRRLSWVPEDVFFRRFTEPVLRYEPTEQSWPEGTEETALALDRLEVPLDASIRAAQKVLKAAQEGRRYELIRDALRWRIAQVKERHGLGG